MALKPWMTPDDTVEVIEFLDELSLNFKSAAMWGNLRKDLRKTILDWADKSENMSYRFQAIRTDDSLMIALDKIAEQEHQPRINIIVMALEEYVSNRNKRKGEK